ncbi:hypothetical protein PDENDC454_04239 [Paenibacillus dendritiformis C454]|uniref:Adenine-specific DNA methyltransferase n=1 Tax=Paenibacillus dendritiformis C454 TaxID=1131935 RepID=H3SBG2_9BACL|nr:MT-A70 family methyltransferase [Paenibacillus dendritiformis]EHQ63645.1 hypothetical protein PDENDC454_04239 [Paenibacillus dendritiformis C454]
MKYDIIYADPPWAYRQKGRGAAENHYPVMTTDELIRLPIRDIASDKAICFMWATFPNYMEAVRLMQAWGFEYKTAAFIWVKKYPKSDAHVVGMGAYTRANAEPLLIGISKATRAKQQVISRSIRQIVETNEPEVVEAPKEQHSKKPAIFRNKITELLGDVSRIELFARQRFPGWHAWGNEVESDIILPVQIG